MHHTIGHELVDSGVHVLDAGIGDHVHPRPWFCRGQREDSRDPASTKSSFALDVMQETATSTVGALLSHAVRRTMLPSIASSQRR